MGGSCGSFPGMGILKSKTTKVILLGQCMSLCIAGMSFCVSILADRGVMLPYFLNMVAYGTLAIMYVPFIFGRPMKLEFWKYMVYTMFDVAANALILTSYQYTSMTSIMLLGCLTTPVAMVLSTVLLAATYNNWHIISAIVCLGGSAMIVVSDHRSRSDGHTDTLGGDLLAMCGAVLYGTSNVLQEMIVKRNDRTEFLAMLGLIGVCYSSITAAGFGDFQQFADRDYFTFSVIGLCFGYIFCYCAFMSGVSYFLTMADAASFNLSILTSNLYGVMIGYYVHNLSINVLYAFGIALIIGGIICYNLQPPVTGSENESDLSSETISNSDGNMNIKVK